MSKLSLEKDLDLALVRSRSRLGREDERLGLVKMWEGLSLGLKNKRLGLTPQGLVYITGQLVNTKLCLFISHTFCYHSPSYHSRKNFYVNLLVSVYE